MAAKSYEPRRLAGRCANGAERDRGRLYHAVPMRYGSVTGDIWGPALCGQKPGRLSAGWSEAAGTEVTCKRCLRKLRKES